MKPQEREKPSRRAFQRHPRQNGMIGLSETFKVNRPPSVSASSVKPRRRHERHERPKADTGQVSQSNDRSKLHTSMGSQQGVQPGPAGLWRRFQALVPGKPCRCSQVCAVNPAVRLTPIPFNPLVEPIAECQAGVCKISA
jgi:hypothetical protein